MEKIKTFYKSVFGKVVILVLILGVGFTVRNKLQEEYNRKANIGTGKVTMYEEGDRVGRELEYAENVAEDHHILQKFKELYPDGKVLLACEEDMTNDGLKDLVVVFNNPASDEYSTYTQLVDGGHIRLVVLIDTGDGENYSCSVPIPAPVENQRIKFQNIDSQEEMEFILQGQKGSKVGYGIFRVMEGEPVSLFDQGMEEC